MTNGHGGNHGQGPDQFLLWSPYCTAGNVHLALRTSQNFDDVPSHQAFSGGLAAAKVQGHLLP